MEDELQTPAPPENASEGGNSLGEAFASFVKAIAQIIKGLLVFLLRLIPVLLWVLAVLFWGYRLYCLLQVTIGLYAPNGQVVPLTAWIAIVLLTNLPAIAGNIYRAREGGRREKFFRFGGVVLGMGLADMGAQTLLQTLSQHAPLLALSLPHLFLGVGVVFTKVPTPAKVAHQGGSL